MASLPAARAPSSASDTPQLKAGASRLERAISQVSAGTTRMTPGYVNGVRITHRRGERGTRLDRPVPSYRQDIGRPHDIPWGHYPASAPIHAPACAPPPAHGAGLRRIRFVDLKGAARLVIELSDLCRQARIASFGPLLPACFGGPAPVQPPDAMVTLHHVGPQACRLFARRRERGPLGVACGHPSDFYCAIAHAGSVSWRSAYSLHFPVRRLTRRPADAPFIPMSEVRGSLVANTQLISREPAPRR